MKKTIAVLFGGCSPEHEVSLQSAFSVLQAIDTKKYLNGRINRPRVDRA